MSLFWNWKFSSSGRWSHRHPFIFFFLFGPLAFLISLFLSQCALSMDYWFFPHPKWSKNSATSNPFCRFSRFSSPPKIFLLSHSMKLLCKSRVLVIANSTERGASRRSSTHVYIHRMLFLRYICCCCCCFMYGRYSYEFMKKIRIRFYICLAFLLRTGEKFLNLPFFFSRLTSARIQKLDRNLNFPKFLPSRSGQFLEK